MSLLYLNEKDENKLRFRNLTRKVLVEKFGYFDYVEKFLHHQENKHIDWVKGRYLVKIFQKYTVEYVGFIIIYYGKCTLKRFNSRKIERRGAFAVYPPKNKNIYSCLNNKIKNNQIEFDKFEDTDVAWFLKHLEDL